MTRTESYLEIPDPRYFLEKLNGTDKSIHIGFFVDKITFRIERTAITKQAVDAVLIISELGEFYSEFYSISSDVEDSIMVCISILNGESKPISGNHA